MKIYRKQTPKDVREKIVLEYLSGQEPASAIALRYDVPVGNIHQWVHRYVHEEKNVSMPSELPKDNNMARAKRQSPETENEALKKRLKELEDRLHYAELQNLALNTMIDIAEEQGIQIRKKSGAKQ